jgi:hypothetical protein
MDWIKEKTKEIILNISTFKNSFHLNVLFITEIKHKQPIWWLLECVLMFQSPSKTLSNLVNSNRIFKKIKLKFFTIKKYYKILLILNKHKETYQKINKIFKIILANQQYPLE